MARDNDDGFMAAFASLVSVFEGGGDKGKITPESDSKDLQNGATWIPGEVTQARRDGKTVSFVQGSSKDQWHWMMPDGSVIMFEDRVSP